jgi:hypothetical protein
LAETPAKATVEAVMMVNFMMLVELKNINDERSKCWHREC